jgi:GT2 family glycosyltransferase
MKVSILILDYLKADRVIKNVKSLLKQQINFDLEICVVDNSANLRNSQKLIKAFKDLPEVLLKIADKNLGYTRGNNWGAKALTGKYLLIVNPDIIWKDSHTLQTMVDFMENNKQVGICGPKQMNENNQGRAMSVRKFPNLFLQIARRTFFRHIPGIKSAVIKDECLNLDATKTQVVDWLQSSCILIKKSLWDQIGGFDEDYFLFMADTQLCRDAWKHGFKVIFLVEAVVEADGIRCSAGGFQTFFKSWVLRQHLKDSLLYFKKNLFTKNPRDFYQKNLKKQN